MHQRPSPRILLAEEQAASRDLLVLVLGKLGYRIESVTTARDALERLASGKLSLVLAPPSPAAPVRGSCRRFVPALVDPCTLR
jgi:CheY-like chemotaxis protein